MLSPLADSETLPLLDEMVSELGCALNSLGGKPDEGYEKKYAFYSAVLVKRAAEGFVALRKFGALDASRLLVRPALEALLRVNAVRQKPELFFRIAYSEHEEDLKWMRLVSANDPTTNAPDLAAMEADWTTFKANYASAFPNLPAAESAISLRRLAELGGMVGYYDVYYRLYCRFTHVAIRAIMGHLDDSRGEDVRTMTLCVLAALEALIDLGASSTNHAAFVERLRVQTAALEAHFSNAEE